MLAHPDLAAPLTAHFPDGELATGALQRGWSVFVSSFAGLSAADRCFVTSPLCLVVLAVFTWIGQRVRPRSEAKARHVDDFFARMKGGPINWNYLPGWLGLACAAAALGSIIGIWLLPDLLPKPLNVVGTLSEVFSVAM